MPRKASRLIALDNGAKLSGLQRIVENDTPAESDSEDNPDSAGAAGNEEGTP